MSNVRILVSRNKREGRYQGNELWLQDNGKIIRRHTRHYVLNLRYWARHWL